MKIIKVYPRGFGANAYILTTDGKTAVVVDPADGRVLETLAESGLECKAVLLTHGHFDHVGACGELFEIDARIYCGEREKDLIFSKEYLGIFGGVEVPEFKVYKTLSDGEKLTACGMEFTVMATAGHTAGSVCYVVDGCIFTGDTLFKNGVGRWDLPTGNFEELCASLKKVNSLSGDYTLYCGHGSDTSLAVERKENPYLRNIKC